MEKLIAKKSKCGKDCNSQHEGTNIWDSYISEAMTNETDTAKKLRKIISILTPTYHMNLLRVVINIALLQKVSFVVTISPVKQWCLAIWTEIYQQKPVNSQDYFARILNARQQVLNLAKE
jgi:hypothetical protein